VGKRKKGGKKKKGEKVREEKEGRIGRGGHPFSRNNPIEGN